jgi:hypothetical protein
MAIAFDTAIDVGTSGGAVTFSHTCTGSDLLLVVAVAIRNNKSQTVTSVTYNGIDLSLERTAINGLSVRSEIWRLAGPATGANDVVVTLSKGAKFAAAALSFTGVDQTTPTEIDNGATGSSTSPSVALNSTTDEAWIVDSVVFRSSTGTGLPTLVVGASQTEQTREFLESGSIAGRVRQGTSTEGPISPVASTTMSWTLGDSVDWATAAMQIRPLVGASTTPINQTAAMNIEATGGITQTKVLHIESLQPINQTQILHIESLQPTNQTAVINIESSLGVLQTSILNIEALQGISATADINIEALSEAVTVVSQLAAINIESIQAGISQTSIINIESLQGINQTAIVNIESIALINQTNLLNIEALQGIQATAIINIEALGTFGAKTYVIFGNITRQITPLTQLTYSFEAILATNDIQRAVSARIFSTTSQIAIATSSVANPTVITTSVAHGLSTDDEVRISDHIGSVPTLDGNYIITKISDLTYSIPVNVTTAGTGGLSIIGSTIGASEVTTLSTIPERVRSSAFTLSGTKEYRVEFGGVGGGSYTIYAADVVLGS